MDCFFCFHYSLLPKCKAWGSWIEVEEISMLLTLNTDQENKGSKMFIISLGNWIELESTPQYKTILYSSDKNQNYKISPERGYPKVKGV